MILGSWHFFCFVGVKGWKVHLSRKPLPVHQELRHNEFQWDLRSFAEPSAYLQGFINRSLQAKVPKAGGVGNRIIIPRKRLKHLLPGVGFRILRERLPVGLFPYCTPSIPPPWQTESWQTRWMTACQLRGLLEGDMRVQRGRRTQRGMHGRRALSWSKVRPAPRQEGPRVPITAGGSASLRALGRQVGSRPGRQERSRSAGPGPSARANPTPSRFAPATAQRDSGLLPARSSKPAGLQPPASRVTPERGLGGRRHLAAAFRGAGAAPESPGRKEHGRSPALPPTVGHRSRRGRRRRGLRRPDLSGEAGALSPSPGPAALTWAGARRAGSPRSLLSRSDSGRVGSGSQARAHWPASP